MIRRFVFLALLIGLFPVLDAGPAVADDGLEVGLHQIVFPVQGGTTYSNDWGAPRSGGRRHKGNDIFGFKGQPVVSATDGTVVRIGLDGTNALSGNYLVVEDQDGWETLYIHLNNDTPGTDDNLNPLDRAFAPGVEVGTKVRAGQVIGYLGDSGNAEAIAPQLHFEVHQPDGTAVNPYPNLRISQGFRQGNHCRFDTNPPPTPDRSAAKGYWVLNADGGVFSFGDAPFHGSMGGKPLNKPLVGMTALDAGNGYWQVAQDGGIFAFGDAGFFGSTGSMVLNKPIVGMAATPSGDGYWMVASDGGIFAFGDAGFFGSTGSMVLNRPIVGMSPTSTGNGYWLVASDGGVFAFGDAGFFGSTADLDLAEPIVDIALRDDGDGYWMLAADGGVFGFGASEVHGSIPGAGLCNAPRAVRLLPTSTGDGYWIEGANGSTWAFGDAFDLGSVKGLGLGITTPSIDLVKAG